MTYVRSLSGAESEGADRPEALAAGKKVFDVYCVGCHNRDGTGNPKMGAPNLTDDFWIYGGDPQSVYLSVYQGRQGHMPHWEGRLSALQRKIITLFVLDQKSVAQ